MQAIRYLGMLLFCMLPWTMVSADYLNTQVRFTEEVPAEGDTLIVLVPADSSQVSLPEWPTDTGVQVSRALEAVDFTGKERQQAEILAPIGLAVDRLWVVGVGSPAELSRHDAEEIGAELANRANGSRAQLITVDTRLIASNSTNASISAAIAHGMDLRNYRFDRYKSEPDSRPEQRYRWTVLAAEEAQQQYDRLRALAEGVFLARELTNLTGADGYPEAFAQQVLEALTPLNVEVTILGPEQVLEAGMGSLYGVSAGSQHKAHMLTVHWKGSDDPPIALVGKGNTFDTGGYNLKTTSSSILTMQTDKAGGASVVGAVMALAGQQVPINVVGVIPLSQNAISGEATLPGDVLTAGDGTTIEVGSTDAEGRLILADGLWYARDRYQPRVMADIATLTGAKITAVGTDYSAVFTDDETILATIKAAGELTNELVWQLPLGPYRGIVDSRIADLINTGSPGAQAGAVFLQHFAGDTPWVHIDMAGQALLTSARGIHPEGATGHGVRLLTEWVRIYAEEVPVAP